MSVSRTRALLVAATAAILPIAASCSNEGQGANRAVDPSSVDTNQNPLATVITPKENIPASIQCGRPDSGPNSKVEVLTDEYLLITTNGGEENVIEHARRPLEIAVRDGSSDAFAKAVTSSQNSLLPVPIPSGAKGNAVITYKGLTPDSEIVFVVQQDFDNSILINLASDTASAVAYQVADGAGNLMFLGDGTTFDIEPDAIASLQTGNGSYLRKPLVSSTGKAGVAIADATGTQACVLKLGADSERAI